MHTTLALSHLALGLATTRAHDVFYDPEPGVAAPYGHHPPALALLVAAFFALTGSATPAVARLVVIACHLGSLILLMGILEHLVSRGAAGLGGLAFATLPMSAYFGRMVNYEPVCLFGVMLALGGWLALRQDGPPNGRARLIGGFAFGGLVDWAAFFFAGALVLAEVPDAWRGRRGSRLVVISVSATAALIMALNLWHLWWANRGSLAPLWEVVPGPVEHLSLFELVARPVETFRLYFTHAGLLASLAVLGSLLYRRTTVPRLLESPDPASALYL
jgi:4-amino-4-deoxy-L-arabinose transferase-like glycosyltransferase